MRTEQLIHMLAQHAEPVPWHSVSHILRGAWVKGAALSLLVLVLFYGVRPDLGQAVQDAVFWLKLGAAAFWVPVLYILLHRIARPGMPWGQVAWVALLPFAVLWGAASWAYISAPPDQRADQVWGQTWQTCSASIGLISIPVWVALMRAMKLLAPTQPIWAGACAGYLAGATAILVYALHCPESSFVFVGIWYVLGAAVPAGLGAWVGGRWLRW